MKAIDPRFLEQSREIFASVSGISLQDIRDRVAVNSTGTARRDMLSAVDTAARVFNRSLGSVRATPAAIRGLFGKVSGPELGISPKRLANIRSEIGRALRLYGEPIKPITKRIPLSQDWSALLGRITVKHHRMALNRFACFCSAVEIAPTEVGPKSLLGFHAALEAEEVVKNPQTLLKTTIAIWNTCRRGVPGWPEVTLSSPYKVNAFTLALSDFPESFQSDVANWVSLMTNSHPLDTDAPARALRPATIKNRIFDFRRFGSALVHRGDLTIDQITGIHVFFEHDHYRSGLRFFLQRFNNKPTAGIQGLANHLRYIAKHYCKIPPEVLKQMEAVCAKLDPGTNGQLAPRNRERLRQFDDPKNVAKLLAFPAEERVRGRKQRNQIRAARCMERALAIDILIHCCVRIQNLRTIHLTKNHRIVGGKHYLIFEAHEVKNRKALDFELSEDLAEALTEFREKYRPRLPGADGPYLFPGEDGGPRSHNALRTSIGKVLRTRSGLLMHPHLFRHAIAKIVVERNPDLYPAISQHLGHKSLNMTMANYLGTETRASARHIDRLLSAARADPTSKKD